MDIAHTEQLLNALQQEACLHDAERALIGTRYVERLLHNIFWGKD